MKTNIFRIIGLGMVATASALSITGCQDFFEPESNHIIFADGDHLNNPTDTVYSMVGILQKLQAIADRSVLLGEVRGDLVDVNEYTSADLRDIALFELDDSANVYNQPRDYYAVINNCNYYITRADTALKNNRNETIFMREYAAAKTYRAWTYLQLVLAYGKVPFVTEPILLSGDLDRDYPKLEVKDICERLIADLTPVADENIPLFNGLTVDSRLAYIPTKILLGDLCLWAGRYREAAQWYYRYISTRNGEQSAYTVGTGCAAWARDEKDYRNRGWNNSYTTFFLSESYGTDIELISLIPCPTGTADLNYSQLRNIFCSTNDNAYQVQLEPSDALTDLSEAQVYCNYNTANEVVYVPDDLPEGGRGDLRLNSIVLGYTTNYDNTYRQAQEIYKFSSTNVRTYRRAMVYLRMAEALNRAGYPRFAYEILADGVNDSIVRARILPYCPTLTDSMFVQSFSFPENRYIVRCLDTKAADINTIGLHSRGSGWTEFNEHYAFPVAPEGVTDTLQYQIEKVEDMLMDEGALELAFEGQRFYDLMRVALRRNDPSYLAEKVYARRGEDRKGEMRSLIRPQLTDMRSWYMSWRGQIGY